MDAWCSGGGADTWRPSATVTREVLVGRADGDERDGQIGRDAGHHDLVHAHVAQDGEHLGAVHRRDALVPRQDQVVGARPRSRARSRGRGRASRQAAVDAVARMSGERWLAERPPARGR